MRAIRRRVPPRLEAGGSWRDGRCYRLIWLTAWVTRAWARAPAGDLRYAINQADQAPRNSTILFCPTLDGQTITLTAGIAGDRQALGHAHDPGTGRRRPGRSPAADRARSWRSCRASQVQYQWVDRDRRHRDGGRRDLEQRRAHPGRLHHHRQHRPWADGGGGIYNGPLGTMTISDSTISGNISDARRWRRHRQRRVHDDHPAAPSAATRAAAVGSTAAASPTPAPWPIGDSTDQRQPRHCTAAAAASPTRPR